MENLNKNYFVAILSFLVLFSFIYGILFSIKKYKDKEDSKEAAKNATIDTFISIGSLIAITFIILLMTNMNAWDIFFFGTYVIQGLFYFISAIASAFN